MFLRFLRMLIKLFAAITFLTWTVILPIDAAGIRDANFKDGLARLSWGKCVFRALVTPSETLTRLASFRAAYPTLRTNAMLRISWSYTSPLVRALSISQLLTPFDFMFHVPPSQSSLSGLSGANSFTTRKCVKHSSYPSPTPISLKRVRCSSRRYPWRCATRRS